MSLEQFMMDYGQILAVLAIALAAYMIGRATTKQTKENICISSEIEIKNTAMSQIDKLFYDATCSDEEFGREATRIRSLFRPVAEQLRRKK